MKTPNYSLWEMQSNHPTTITAFINGKNVTPLVPENMRKVLEDIYTLISTQIETQITDTTIWNAEDIANWLKLSSSLVKRTVIVRPGFPPAITPCSAEATTTFRWFAKDIITWAKKNKSNIPQGRRSRGRPRANI